MKFPRNMSMFGIVTPTKNTNRIDATTKTAIKKPEINNKVSNSNIMNDNGVGANKRRTNKTSTTIKKSIEEKDIAFENIESINIDEDNENDENDDEDLNNYEEIQEMSSNDEELDTKAIDVKTSRKRKIHNGMVNRRQMLRRDNSSKGLSSVLQKPSKKVSIARHLFVAAMNCVRFSLGVTTSTIITHALVGTSNTYMSQFIRSLVYSSTGFVQTAWDKASESLTHLDNTLMRNGSILNNTIIENAATDLSNDEGYIVGDYNIFNSVVSYLKEK